MKWLVSGGKGESMSSTHLKWPGANLPASWGRVPAPQGFSSAQQVDPPVCEIVP